MSDQLSRRSLLASIGVVALAGCPAGDGTSDSTDVPQQYRSGTDTPTEAASTSAGTPTGSTPTDTPTATPRTPAPPDSIGSAWPMPAHDPGRSNYAPDASGPTESVAELWTASTGTDLSEPVVADGVLFVGGSDGTVRAFDARTGETRWERSVGGTAGTPRIVNGRLTVPTDRSVVALDAEDGTERWTVTADAPLGDFVAAGHGFYYVTDDPTADQFEEKPSVVAIGWKGRTRWRTTVEDPWQPTIFTSGTRVFVPSGTHDMLPWMLSTPTGEVVNERPPARGADFPSARFYRNGRLVTIDGFFGNIRAVALATDVEGWSAGIGKGGTYAASGGGDRVYVGHKAYEESQARLFALSVSTGNREWEVTGLSGFPGRPVVGTETVVVRTDDQLRCFDPSDGTERWRRPAGDLGDQFVLVDDLLLTTQDGTVRALRPL